MDDHQPLLLHRINDHPIKTYARRWLMLFLFSFFSFSNAICWITFAPISSKILSFSHSHTDTHISHRMENRTGKAK